MLKHPSFHEISRFLVSVVCQTTKKAEKYWISKELQKGFFLFTLAFVVRSEKFFQELNWFSVFPFPREMSNWAVSDGLRKGKKRLIIEKKLQLSPEILLHESFPTPRVARPSSTPLKLRRLSRQLKATRWNSGRNATA
jgi:hypothetical protein